MSDQKILEFFKNGQREKAFRYLYRLYPKIERLILSKGGQKQDARDVFQESLIILNRNLETTEFKLTSSFYTYLYAVSRFIWKDQQKRNNKNSKNKINENHEELFQKAQEEKKFQFAERAFSELGERCQQLLQLFYHNGMRFKEIAEVMQFSSEKIAKNQKYKCLSKAKGIYQEKYKSIQS